MYSDIFILQLYQCPNLSGTSLSMWACVSRWLGELGKQRADHTKITQTGYPAYALSIKMDTEKTTTTKKTMSLELAGRHLRNGKQTV